MVVGFLSERSSKAAVRKGRTIHAMAYHLSRRG